MLHQSALSSDAVASGALNVEIIKSRFGEIQIDTTKSVGFPRGMLGMPDRFHFVLTKFPSEKMQQFMLLQSLEDSALSFITLPVELENPIIAVEDLKSAAHDLQISFGNLAVLLVVSVHRSPDQVRLSVNARAPLLIDIERKLGAQHVFQQDHYKVQHMLGS
jgi:flagellar assembly factor FliW